MKVFSQIKGVDVRQERNEGSVRLCQHVLCSRCDETLRLAPSASGAVLPEGFVNKKARQEGWLMKKNGRHVCASCREPSEMADEAVREMSVSERRKIFREIDENYDEANSRYCDTATDATIAKKLGVPRKWVTDLREENFGPAGENVEMQRLASNLGNMQVKLTDAINAAMEAASNAETLKSEVDTMRASLDQIKAAVGPYRAA